MFKKMWFFGFLVTILVISNASAGIFENAINFARGKKKKSAVVDSCARLKSGHVVLEQGESLLGFWTKHKNCPDISELNVLAKFNGIVNSVSLLKQPKTIIIPTKEQVDSMNAVSAVKEKSEQKPAVNEFNSVAPGDSFQLAAPAKVSEIAKGLGTSLKSFAKANGLDAAVDQTVEAGRWLVCPKKDINRSNLPNASEVERPKVGRIADYKFPGKDPLRCSILEAFDRFECSRWPGVREIFEKKLRDNDTTEERFNFYWGRVVKGMVGGNCYLYGVHGLRGSWKDPAKSLYGRRYIIDLTDSIIEIGILDTCRNPVWDIIYPPPEEIVIKDETPGLVVVPPPPPPEVEEPPKVDTSSVRPLKKKRKPYGEIFLWTGYYAPLPVFSHGHFYLGGIGNGFIPIGKYSGLGLSLKANGYQGWSPRFYDKKGEEYFGTYAGAMLGLGPILDLQTRSNDWNKGFNTRTTFACRVFYRHDWHEENHDNVRYWNRQGTRHWYLPQSFGPEFTSYIANSDWSKWFQAWVGLNQDLAFISGNMNYVYREAHLNGEKRSIQDDPPSNKTVVDWGLGWFFWPLSSSKNVTLGVKTQGNHMWEDNRWELGGGPSLRVKQWQFGFEGKNTFNSKYNKQNGWSIKFSVDIDPTPRNKKLKSKPSDSIPDFSLEKEVVSPVDSSDFDFGEVFDDDPEGESSDATITPTATPLMDFSDVFKK